MELVLSLWDRWVASIGLALDGLADGLGLGTGLAIIVLTLLIKVAMLPLTARVAYFGAIRQKRLARLAPQIDRLKQRHADDPAALGRELLRTYERNGLKLIEFRPLLAALIQLPVVLGVFHCLRDLATRAAEGGRFLWVANLSKPDLALALIAGLSTALLVAFGPEIPEPARQLMLIVPCLLMVVVAIKLSSGLALYWTASNLVSAAQAAGVRELVRRREARGALDL